jgi:hypothetical protein
VPYGKCALFAYTGNGSESYWEWVGGIMQSLTPSDVGLGNVGNYKAVSTVANQGLSTTEQSNARANIGAGTSSLVLGETSTNAYRGDRGKIAYDHTSLRNNPHGVTQSQVGLGNVDNTSDATKKTNFTGAIASSNTGFVTGGDAYTALHSITDYDHRNCGYHYCTYFNAKNTELCTIFTERDKSTITGTNAKISIKFDSTNTAIFLLMNLANTVNYQYQHAVVECWAKSDFTAVTTTSYGSNNNYFKNETITIGELPNVNYVTFGSIDSYASSMYDGRGRISWNIQITGSLIDKGDLFVRHIEIVLDYTYHSGSYSGIARCSTYPVTDNL